MQLIYKSLTLSMTGIVIPSHACLSVLVEVIWVEEGGVRATSGDIGWIFRGLL